jgi:ABC-type multidrug transport system permease subunit
MELLLFVAWMLGSLFVAVIGLVATERFSRFLLWGGVALVFSPPLALLGLVVVVLKEIRERLEGVNGGGR